jgi:hypothetical protein
MGKRARASASEDAIPRFLGVPEVKATDPPEVRHVLELTSINVESWLASLSADQLNELSKAVDANEARGRNHY